jgi:hypothetical protein
MISILLLGSNPLDRAVQRLALVASVSVSDSPSERWQRIMTEMARDRRLKWFVTTLCQLCDRLSNCMNLHHQ